MPIKVFVVESSAVNRAFLRELFSQRRGFELVGVASTPLIAIKRLLRQEADLLICDYNTSAMPALDFLRYIQRNSNTKCIFLMPTMPEEKQVTERALHVGAIACVHKPRLYDQSSAKIFEQQLLTTIASYYKVQERLIAVNLTSVKSFDIVAIGSSTGGTVLIESLLAKLDAESPCVLIVQHMPEKFTKNFAQRLDSLVNIEVKEAADGDKLRPGLALIAAGGKHLRVVRHAGELKAHVFCGQTQHHHMPSVDVLFDSLAALNSMSIFALLLTGMGKDGAKGMLHLKQKGAFTVALSQEDCVVYGMPRAAKALGAVSKEMSLDQLKREFSLLQAIRRP